MELFCEKCTEWSDVIYAISCFDVLRSFAAVSKFSPGLMCRPIILPLSKQLSVSDECMGPTLKLKGLWHPFALGAHGGLPVPNDIHLGHNTYGYHPCTLLLTGPNMGGKSTLLRATCLAVIMAQVLSINLKLCYSEVYICFSLYVLIGILHFKSHWFHEYIFYGSQLGCYVPCENCALSLVDIIFTRLGASDRIMTGESKSLDTI